MPLLDKKMYLCKDINLKLELKNVIDSEFAIHIAVNNIPSKVTQCNFHLNKSWWWKVWKLGLTMEFKTNDFEIGEWKNNKYTDYLFEIYIGENFCQTYGRQWSHLQQWQPMYVRKLL